MAGDTVYNMAVNLKLNASQYKTTADAIAKQNANLGDTFKKLTGVINQTARSLTFFVSLPMAYAIKRAADNLGEFEQRMRNVNTIARMNEEQLALVSRQVEYMAVRYGTSANDIAKALYDINSASFKGSDAMLILEQSAVSARAGLATVEESARLITSILNAYQMRAKDAAAISDILFKTVERGVTTFHEIARGAGTAIAASASAKIPFEQVAAALAIMTKAGIGAQESFTSINRLILRIVKGGKELNNLFAQTEEGTGSLMLANRGLVGTMKFLGEVTSGDVDKLQQLGFQVRDLKAAITLTRDSGMLFYKEMAELGEASRRNSAIKAMTEQTKSLKFEFDKAREALGLLTRSISREFKGAIKDVTSAIIDLSKYVDKMDSGWKSLIAKFTVFTTVAAPVVWFLSSIANTLTKIAALSPALTGVVLKLGAIGGLYTAVAVGMATLGYIGSPLGYSANVDKNMEQFEVFRGKQEAALLALSNVRTRVGKAEEVYGNVANANTGDAISNYNEMLALLDVYNAKIAEASHIEARRLKFAQDFFALGDKGYQMPKLVEAFQYGFDQKALQRIAEMSKTADELRAKLADLWVAAEMQKAQDALKNLTSQVERRMLPVVSDFGKEVRKNDDKWAYALEQMNNDYDESLGKLKEIRDELLRTFDPMYVDDFFTRYKESLDKLRSERIGIIDEQRREERRKEYEQAKDSFLGLTLSSTGRQRYDIIKRRDELVAQFKDNPRAVIAIYRRARRAIENLYNVDQQTQMSSPVRSEALLRGSVEAYQVRMRAKEGGADVDKKALEYQRKIAEAQDQAHKDRRDIVAALGLINQSKVAQF